MNIDIKRISCPEEMNDYYAVRKAVFTDEQGVDPAIERDDFDDAPMTRHYVLFSEGVAAAVGRVIFPDDEKTAKVGRVAALKETRGKKLGQAIMAFIVDDIKSNTACATIKLTAQTHAIRFYEKLGFIPYGEFFEEAGIPHLAMEMDIKRAAWRLRK